MVFEFRCWSASTETMRTTRDGEPRTATSTFTQLLSSEIKQSCIPPVNKVPTRSSGQHLVRREAWLRSHQLGTLHPTVPLYLMSKVGNSLCISIEARTTRKSWMVEKLMAWDRLVRGETRSTLYRKWSCRSRSTRKVNDRSYLRRGLIDHQSVINRLS